MNYMLAVLIVVIAVALIGFAIFALRSAGQSAERGIDRSSDSSIPSRPHPPVSSFHVRGDTASVVFDVPLGESEAGNHLTELLAASAVEHIRAKVAAGLPLEDVTKIDVSAMRGSEAEHLTTIALPGVGELPDAAPILARGEAAHDPIAAVQAVTADASVATPTGRSESLEPVTELVELSTPTEAHLRASGIDTSTMGLEDLVLGLFRVGGYQIAPGRTGLFASHADSTTVFDLTRNGRRTLLVIHPHVAGSYPELDERVLSEFAVAVSQISPDTAMLATDKFSPYVMYERERRDKRLVFVTRERLQAFVDSFGLA